MTRQRTLRATLVTAARRLARRGIDEADLESEVLLAAALGRDRAVLYRDLQRELQPEVARRFWRLIRARRCRVPVAYLLGRREFYGIEFEVGPGVLVPRPETEHLVEAALEHLGGGGGRFLDVGTGSGNIAIALLAARKSARGIGVDRSCDALAYARRNARAVGVAERLALLAADLRQLPELLGAVRFDVIASNPPYVAPADAARVPELGYEPALALVGLERFPGVYRALARAARALLKPEGALALEVGLGQAPTVAEICRGEGSARRVEVRDDLAGVPRVVIARGFPDSA